MLKRDLYREGFVRPIPIGTTCERTKYGIVMIVRQYIEVKHDGWVERRIKVHGVFLNDRPLILVSEHTNRSVWRHRHRIVVKVDRFFNERQGESEYHLFKHMQAQDRKFFAATLYAGDGFSIQAYVKLHAADPYGKHRIAALDLRKVVDRYGIGDISPEYNGRQWGITQQGRPIIHDYGFNDPADAAAVAGPRI